MCNYIWKIRRIGVRYYEITLDPSSFAYDTFPESDRHWRNDNVEELMNEARIITQTNIQSGDHYCKILAGDHNGKIWASDHHCNIWEYANIFFDVDEEVIQEVRYEGREEEEEEIKTSTGCLVVIIEMLIILLIILLTLFCIL